MNNDLIGIAGVAHLIGLTPGTVKVMRARGDLPEPDVVVDGRTKLWEKSTIVEWDSQRVKRYDNRKSNT
jgi:hypothetical protein